MDKAFKIAVILSAYDKMSSIIGGAVNKSTSKLNHLKHEFKEFSERSLIMGEGGTEFFKGAVEAAEQSEVAEKRIAKVFSNMLGEKGKEATEAAAKFADSYQHVIGVEDEAISAVQAKVATFSAIIGKNGEKVDAFNRVTKLTFDMQADGFGDAISNAVQLGKAIQNPALGAAALSKAGAINKEDMPMIKQIQATRGLAAAQEFVLKAVEKQVAGVAASTATASSKASVAWHALEETIGRHLLPTVDRFATYLGTELIPKFEDFIEKNPTLVKWLAGLSVGFLALGTAASVLSFTMNSIVNVISMVGTAFEFLAGVIETVQGVLLGNPIILIIAAIATAAYLIYKNWDEVKAWFIELWNKVTAIFTKAWNWIKNMFLNYTAAGLVIKHWAAISAWFENLWQGVKNIFSNVWEGLKNLFLNYTPQGIIYNHWDEIVNYFTNIWERVKNVFANAWKSIKNGIKSFFGGSSEADAMVSSYEKSLNAVNKKTANAIAFDANNNVNLSGPGSIALRPAPVNSSNSTIHYAPVINYSGSGVQDAAALSGMLKSNFDKQIKDHQERQKRKSF